MSTRVVVHAWSDVSCPWCYLGHERLNKAIVASGEDVAVEFHSYLLQPEGTGPNASGTSYIDALAAMKGANSADIAAMTERVAQAVKGAGLPIDFDNAIWASTGLAHQLIYAAKAAGATPEDAAERGADMVRRLHEAHFAEGKAVDDLDVLVSLAEAAGLDGAATRESLEAGTYKPQVEADIADANRLGITSVPFFVLAGKYGIAGAQPVEVMADALSKVADELRAEEEAAAEEVAEIKRSARKL